MLQIPLTFDDIAQLSEPSERVPLAEHHAYEAALHLIESDSFENYEMQLAEDSTIHMQLFWKDEASPKPAVVRIFERKLFGPVNFSCSLCLKDGRQVSSCKHQWAAFVMLWQALNSTADQIANPLLAKLSAQLREPAFLGGRDEISSPHSEFAHTKLDSISLFLDEPSILKDDGLSRLLKSDLSKYRKHEVSKNEEMLSPRLWNLPEVFRKKLTAFSERYFNEVNEQNRITDLVRYNFSNGMQISAREILRHPLYRKVPGDLLPQTRSETSVFARWPILQQRTHTFVSQALQEPEEVMQALLSKIATARRQNKISLFLQSKSLSGLGKDIKDIEFDPSQEFDWRVEIKDRKELETEFALINFRKNHIHFFESYALDADEGILIVHPWYREFSQLQEIISSIADDIMLSRGDRPIFDIDGEMQAKTILKYLRTRSIPVKITGNSLSIGSHQSLTEVHLNEKGYFYIQHDARVPEQKNLVRKGWTTKSALFLHTLSRGLSFYLNTEARDVATRTTAKRDWDLRILKHLGILQYLMLETLSFHFEGNLTDGSHVEKDQIFKSLHPKIKSLLIAGSTGYFIQDQDLPELCSRQVLSCFEDFVSVVLKAMSSNEAFYSENGEVILEGVVEREFRLIFELLKSLALSTGGETFKRSRTGLLAKLTDGEVDTEIQLSSALFKVPSSGPKEGTNLEAALEPLQQLIPYGFKLFYKGQLLQELQDDEFQVDFLIHGDGKAGALNWFELNPKFFLRGEEVDPENFLSLGRGGAIEFEGKLYLVPQKQMPSMRRLENFWQKLQKGRVESGRKKSGDNIYQLPRHQTLELLALRASGVKFRGDKEWNRLCEFYDSLGASRRELNLPPSMKADLKPYQAEGVRWLQDLYNLRLGALLADDMGLGKTLQTLCFLDDLRSKGELGQVLIVVPSSLIFNWQQEVEKFTPELPLHVFSAKDMDRLSKKLGAKEDMLLITTYGLLMEHEDTLSQYDWKVLVFDEAQNLKNITTKRTSAARSLNAQFKICLTGTPMENHYGEFYSLVDLLVPGSLGKIEDFRRQFVNTEIVTRDEISDLKLKIKPLLLRRTKKEILDQLPEKQETKVSIAFEEKQKEIYRDIALSYNQRVKETMEVQGPASVQLQMLTALLRLRQACSDPAALPNVRYEKVPPKLETLLDSLTEIVESGESALVFTQFIQTLEHTAQILQKAGIEVFVLHGGIPTKQRQKIFADFHNTKGGAVLVMTLKTGGVGLNLTKASYVFHLEPWWNPSVENQATDRAHRLGQTKAVQVFRYIMHESLEEKIELLKDRKDKKFNVLFSNTEKEADVGKGGAALSKEDFDILLGID